MRIILGSHSPRRKDILSFFNIPFIQAASHFDETTVDFGGDPILYCTTLAQKKAETLSALFPEDLIISADTIVYCNNQVLNKPKDRKEAFQMLSLLSDKEHIVYTGVCVAQKQTFKTSCDATKVIFNPLLDTQINNFLDNENYLERSGAYTIQGRGSLLVKSINGCFYNVLGLPVKALYQLLREYNIDLWNYL